MVDATLAKFTRGSFESQCFSGSLIQAQRDMVELRLRKTRQVGASRKVLPQEQIGVFVGAALPGTLWIAEVDLHAEVRFAFAAGDASARDNERGAFIKH